MLTEMFKVLRGISSYEKFTLTDPALAAANLLSASARTGESVRESQNVQSMDRFATTSTQLLKQVHYDVEIPELQKRIRVETTQNSVKSYRDHALKAGLHTVETTATYQDLGTGNDTSLSPANYSMATSRWAVSANLLNINAATGSQIYKQLNLQSSYFHTVTDTWQHASKHTWLRAEGHFYQASQTASRYITHTAEDFYANRRETTGDVVWIADHLKVRVGINSNGGENTKLSGTYGTLSLGTEEALLLESKDRVSLGSSKTDRIEITPGQIQFQTGTSRRHVHREITNATEDYIVYAQNQIIIEAPIISITRKVPPYQPPPEFNLKDSLFEEPEPEENEHPLKDLPNYGRVPLKPTERAPQDRYGEAQIFNAPVGTAGPRSGLSPALGVAALEPTPAGSAPSPTPVDADDD